MKELIMIIALLIHPAQAYSLPDVQGLVEDLEAYHLGFQGGKWLEEKGISPERYTHAVQALEVRASEEKPVDRKGFPRTVVNYWEGDRAILVYHVDSIRAGIQLDLGAVYTLVHHELLNLSAAVELTDSDDVASIYRESRDDSADSSFLLGLRHSVFGKDNGRLSCRDTRTSREFTWDVRANQVCTSPDNVCSSVTPSVAVTISSPRHTPGTRGRPYFLLNPYDPGENIEFELYSGILPEDGELKGNLMEELTWRTRRGKDRYDRNRPREGYFRCRVLCSAN